MRQEILQNPLCPCAWAMWHHLGSLCSCGQDLTNAREENADRLYSFSPPETEQLIGFLEDSSRRWSDLLHVILSGGQSADTLLFPLSFVLPYPVLLYPSCFPRIECCKNIAAHKILLRALVSQEPVLINAPPDLSAPRLPFYSPPRSWSRDSAGCISQTFFASLFTGSARRKTGGQFELKKQRQEERICLQCWRPGFDPWIGKISSRREWLPTPVFLSGELHGQRSLAD